MKIVSSEQMKKIDEDCIKEGILGLTLMEKAGKGFVEVLSEKFTNLKEKKVLVLVGKGNNGGDGLVVARRLFKGGTKVKIVLLASPPEMAENTKINFDKAKGLGIDFVEYSKEKQNIFKIEIEKTDLIVDAIFGTGFKSDIPEPIDELIELINNSKKFIVACDIPSGINGTTGKISNICICADLTVTFGLPKRGLFLSPGRDFVGEIRIVNIGIPSSIMERVVVKERLLNLEEIERFLPQRKKRDVCKNDFGHVLVLAGSQGMTGAAALTCQGAIYVGAGLVTLAIPESLNQIMEVKLTEVMTLPLPERNKKVLSLRSFEKISDFIDRRRVSVLAIGPGLSTDGEVGKLVEKILLNTDLPCILDADALNLLVGKIEIFKKTKAKLIITPHSGELGRLMGKCTSEIQKERIEYTKKFARDNNLICLLKGYQTIVSNGDMLYLNSTGNQGMASAGMGDVLCGMIAGLVSQMAGGVDGVRFSSLEELLIVAANVGVYLHGLAGDLACNKKGPLSLVASDLKDSIPEAIKNISEHLKTREKIYEN